MTKTFILRGLLPAGICAALLSGPMASTLRAEDKEPDVRPRNTDAESEHDEHERLEHLMESIARSMKKLEKQVADPKQNEASLKLVTEIASAVQQAKLIVPGGVKRLPESDRAKAATEYRKMMGNVQRELLDLEDNLLDNKNEDAVENVKTIREVQKTGHDEYRVKDDD